MNLLLKGSRGGGGRGEGCTSRAHHFLYFLRLINNVYIEAQITRSTFPVVLSTSVAGSLAGLPDAFLVAFISDPRADATSLAAFSNIC